MKSLNLVLLILSGVLSGASVACGEETAASSPTDTPAIVVEQTEPPIANVDQPQIEGLSGCEDYFQFCVTATTNGDVTASATTGTNHYHVSNCAEWAAAGDTRILELPFITGAGENKMTIALSRIGEYDGPGRYELTAVSTTGMPDMFPAIAIEERTFSNGEGSTAVVTMAADGSGSLQATNLVEIASFQVSNPDPAALVDFSMEWTCQDLE